MKNRFLFAALAALLVMTMSSCVFLSTDHVHQFGDEWTTDETSHWHVCAGEECTEIADKADHTGGTATETEKAKCEVCGAEYGELKTHEHAYGEWQTKTLATCTTAGVEIRTCSCGAEEVRDTAKLDHSFTKEVVDEKYLATANCEEQATYFKSCACGAKGTDTFAYGEVIAHAYGEWQTKTPATCDDAEVEYRACACSKEETRSGDAALGHNMVNNSDDTHHWTECDREGCDEATEKVAHSATSISAVCNMANPMESMTVKASDLTVTAVCACGKSYTVTDVTLENATLALGENTVTVKYGEASTTVKVVAAEFNMVIDGTIIADTHINSGSNGSNYSDRTELYIYNKSMYRVFFKFNFSDALNNEYYNLYKDEAKVQFTFTITNGVDVTGLPVLFKAYGATDVRSNADFSAMTWANYNSTYTLGWGSDNNTVALLNSEPVGDRATYADGKLVITVTLRELDGCIDADGNAIFVLLTDQKDLKPFVASMENTEFAVPAVKVILNGDHSHAYINEVAEDKYLASANCEEKATYYYSCSCGEKGTDTFEYGEVIAHSYGEWQTKTAATCTAAEVEYRVCACSAEETREGDAALGHDMETKFDETNHWTDCSRCDEATEPVAHFGGTATETEQATCEGCGQKYGGTASHVHVYGEWQTKTAATCTEAELEFRKCACGAEETQTGDAALGHNMETKYDADNHWTECSRCDEATATEAHSGGTATETEKAVCSTCGQPYGELKEPEKQEYTINGTVKDDTYVMSGSNADKNYASATEINVNTNGTCRVLYRINFSDIVSSADYDASKADAKVRLTFTLTTTGELATSSTVTLKAYNPSETRTAADFSTLTWNTYNTAPNDFGWSTDVVALVSEGYGDKVAYDSATGKIAITISYSDIANCLDANNDVLFVFAIKQSSTKIASMEHETEAYRPKVEYIYEK